MKDLFTVDIHASDQEFATDKLQPIVKLKVLSPAKKPTSTVTRSDVEKAKSGQPVHSSPTGVDQSASFKKTLQEQAALKQRIEFLEKEFYRTASPLRPVDDIPPTEVLKDTLQQEVPRIANSPPLTSPQAFAVARYLLGLDEELKSPPEEEIPTFTPASTAKTLFASYEAFLAGDVSDRRMPPLPSFDPQWRLEQPYLREARRELDKLRSHAYGSHHRSREFDVNELMSAQWEGARNPPPKRDTDQRTQRHQDRSRQERSREPAHDKTGEQPRHVRK